MGVYLDTSRWVPTKISIYSLSDVACSRVKTFKSSMKDFSPIKFQIIIFILPCYLITITGLARLLVIIWCVQNDCLKWMNKFRFDLLNVLRPPFCTLTTHSKLGRRGWLMKMRLAWKKSKKTLDTSKKEIRPEAPGVRAKELIPNFTIIGNCRLGNVLYGMIYM